MLKVELKEIRNKKNGEVLVKNLDFMVAPSEILVLLGPSGSGKTTLLNAIAGLTDEVFEVKGKFILDRQRIDGLPAHHRNLGMIFQEDLLFPHMTVEENLYYGLKPEGKFSFFDRGKVKRSRAKKVREALEIAKIGDRAKAYPKQISGGQKSRVAVMRCLLSDPKAILLDEPFAKLDQQLREEFRQFCFDLLIQREKPAILVTHDSGDIPPNAKIIELG